MNCANLWHLLTNPAECSGPAFGYLEEAAQEYGEPMPWAVNGLIMKKIFSVSPCLSGEKKGLSNESNPANI
jgi:hypothetical protein